MTTVILTIHLLIVLALIGVVLLQRSEGGALGSMGGGGGAGGFMTGRGAANALTRTTSVLAALFFATSISLAIFADRGESELDIQRELTGEEVRDPNAAPTLDELTGTLGADDDDNAAPSEPQTSNDNVSIEDALNALGAETQDASQGATAPQDDAPQNAQPESDEPSGDAADEPSPEPNL
ncbi:MAG: preprotein translocase subunit SecG [Pseudomonadota bacterium]